MKRGWSVQLSVAMLGIGLLAMAARGADPASATPAAKPPARSPATGPSYPVPYSTPATQKVVDVLERLRQRLDAGTPARLLDHPTTRETLPNPDPAQTQPIELTGPTVDRGPEWRFSPISYAMGVIYAGMLQAGNATGDPAFDDFVARHFQFFADNISRVPDSATPRQLYRSPFRALLRPASLDDCGAMGAAFIKARRAGIGPDLSGTINRFADYILHKQHRLADGTLARNRPFKDSVWGDDAYMSVPFLGQMGALSGQSSYYDEAAKQLLQITGRLYVAQTGLFTHAWNEGNPDDHPHYYWGRANGWCMMATVELLDVLPEDHPSRPALLKTLRTQAQAVASLQSGSGLWRQMLDRPDSYLETSCSAMFAYSLARGVNHGWLDAGAYGPVALAAWDGLTTRVTADGRLQGVCIGTGYADDYVYYYARPSGDDVHGYGPVLLAGSEIIRLLENKQYKIEQTRDAPIMLLDKKRDVPLTTRPAP